MKRIMAVFAVSLALLAGACSSGGGGGNETFRVYLTDAPVDGVRAVNVTITSVRIHGSADAGGDAAGWVDVPVTAAMPVDLLRIRGVLYELCAARVEAGHYQQVRLVIRQNAGADPPYRNSVTTKDGVPHPLEVPSDIKLVHSFKVADGTIADLTLDFDAGQSLRQQGNGDYYLQPVITATVATK